MSDDVRYPVAPEAHLRGFQMGFLRLAGCSVGCPGCDTDYSVAERLTPGEIVVRAFQSWPHDRDQWVWITGGEPTDHDLRPLLSEFRKAGYSVAVATSGAKRCIPPVDWLSVSPHSAEPGRFLQRYGNEIKLVDGLNGLDLEEFVAQWDHRIDFLYRYVQPASVAVPKAVRRSGWREDEASLERCLAFLKRHPRWALSRQDHHHWGVA